MKSIIQKLLIATLVSLFSAGTAFAAIAQSPLFLVTSADPNVLFNMSVETPMGGAAYNDQPNASTGCTGRVNDGGTVGICYFKNQEYLGYFDPNKCYAYGSNRFNPRGATNSDHECSGKFSGNFMNWASMTAMDMFVWTMTGGNRVSDGANNTTVIRRTRKQNNNNWFPRKLISSVRNVAPSTVTPWSSSKIYIHNNSFSIKFGTSFNGNEKGTFEAQIRVCNKNKVLEANCVPYGGGSYYKPEGLIQQNADHMRFGATSYTNTSGNGINGGVLRSNIKYVGTTMPDGSGGTTANPLAEILANGTIDTNANSGDASASGVSLSGVITYLNKFSDPGYKGNDPASELFYESIRYFKNLGPTAEYLTGANGGFPILGSSRWQDPIQYECQKNFIIGINDANPWADKRLPGTHFTSSAAWPAANITADFGPPSSPDPDINVTTLTNRVGDLEGLTGTSQKVGCTSTVCDFSNSNKIITGLGEVMGTYPYSRKENSYYIAGLAYYANTEDIRSDFPGRQTISTFMVDSQEYSASPLTGRMNMLWLAGKYGGFVDDEASPDGDPNNGGSPTTSNAEWDADNDGEPDNYVLATEPAKLVSALSQAFSNIEALTSSASAVATNSTRLDTNTKIYQARFNSANWSGQLLAFDIESDGTIGAEAWDAATLIPSESSRNIYSYDPIASGTKGIEFEYTNLNAAQKLLMNTAYSGSVDAFGTDRVDYIRGDTSNEAQNTSGSPPFVFRDRTSLMGDITNSDPWFLGTIEDFGYSSLSGTEGTSYAAHKTAKRSRTPTVFFGAGDGMLHAINATTGAELFTYIPDALIASLSTLTDQFYGCEGGGCHPHQYFVDGAARAADAYFSSAWHSVLVGTLGAGGKGIFALDVTSPSSFIASNILWEISTTQAANASDLADSASIAGFTNNLGYTLPQASIVRLHDGSWAAVVANGYESASKKAILYLINIETGHIIRSFDTKAGSAGSPNGLSTPIAIDEDGDRLTDAVYAGDLLGNLWKFDLSGITSGSWKIAYGTALSPEPLYQAVDGSGTAQPITAKPQVGKHPDGGLMVYFGSGKYYAVNDQIIGGSPQIQTFYGIRDQASKITITDRSNLQEQVILIEDTVAAYDIDIRVTSDNTVDYTTKDGWFMELESPDNGAEGERSVSAPLLRAGRIIFATLIPDPDPCDWGGSSWLMEMDAVSGSRLDTSPFDINNDGVFDSADYEALYDSDGDGDVDGDDDIPPVTGIRRHDLGIIKTPGVVICDDGTECKYTSGSSGDLNMIKESSGSPTGRQSWRQLR